VSKVAASFDEDQALLDRLAALGVDLDAITAELQTAGVASFAGAFDELMEALEAKRAARS
jgi:transaldolase